MISGRRLLAILHYPIEWVVEEEVPSSAKKLTAES
jgi:hypothetical protein